MKRFKRPRKGSDQIENGFFHEDEDVPSRLVRGAITHRERSSDDSTLDERDKANALFLSMGLETPLYLPKERSARNLSNTNLLLSSPATLQSSNSRRDLVEKTANGVHTTAADDSSSLLNPTDLQVFTIDLPETESPAHNPTGLANGSPDHHEKGQQNSEDKREEAQDQVPASDPVVRDDKKAKDSGPLRREKYKPYPILV